MRGHPQDDRLQAGQARILRPAHPGIKRPELLRQPVLVLRRVPRLRPVRDHLPGWGDLAPAARRQGVRHGVRPEQVHRLWLLRQRLPLRRLDHRGEHAARLMNANQGRCPCPPAGGGLKHGPRTPAKGIMTRPPRKGRSSHLYMRRRFPLALYK